MIINLAPEPIRERGRVVGHTVWFRILGRDADGTLDIEVLLRGSHDLPEHTYLIRIFPGMKNEMWADCYRVERLTDNARDNAGVCVQIGKSIPWPAGELALAKELEL